MGAAAAQWLEPGTRQTKEAEQAAPQGEERQAAQVEMANQVEVEVQEHVGAPLWKQRNQANQAAAEQVAARMLARAAAAATELAAGTPRPRQASFCTTPVSPRRPPHLAL